MTWRRPRGGPRPARPRARAARLAVAGALSFGLGALGIACPPRDLTVEVDANGLLTVVASCEGVSRICDGKRVDTCDPLFCFWTWTDAKMTKGVCQIRNQCTLAVDGGHAWQAQTATAVQLMLLSTNPIQQRAASPCLCLDGRTCAGAGADASVLECWAGAVNGLLTTTAPDGLTFSGFSSPDQGVLAMAWFQQDTAAFKECDTFPNGGADLCVEANMVACSGLAAPPGNQTYDITCVSCKDGVHGAIGTDNQPCVTKPDECFLQTCEQALFHPGTP